MAQASDMRTAAVQARRASFEGLPVELRCKIYKLLMPSSMDVLATLKAGKKKQSPFQSLAIYSLRSGDDTNNWHHIEQLRKSNSAIRHEIDDTCGTTAKEVEMKVDLASHRHGEWSSGCLLKMRYPFVDSPSAFSMEHVRYLTLSEVYSFSVLMDPGFAITGLRGPGQIMTFTAKRFIVCFVRNAERTCEIKQTDWVAENTEHGPLEGTYDTQEVREMMGKLRLRPLEIVSSGCMYDLGSEALTARGIYELQERLLSVRGTMVGLVPPHPTVKIQPIQHDRKDLLRL